MNKAILCLQSILLSYFFLSCGSGSVTDELENENIFNEIDSTLNTLAFDKKFSGNVLIVDQTNLVFKKSYGYADFELNQKMSIDRVFQIASVSKQFTAMGIMILKEQGKLNYDDKVTDYLNDFPYKEITIRQLMNHTSGMPDFFDGFLPLFDSTKQNGNKELYDIILNNNLPLKFKTGKQWSYCNVAYQILADIIKHVSGRSYNEFLSSYIFKPLDMTKTQSGISYIPHAGIENTVQGYIFLPDSNKVVLAHDLPKFPYVFYLSKMEGDGSLYSTLHDLLKWDQALYEHKIVSKNTTNEAFEPSLYATGDTVITDWESMYGFGWDISFDENFGKVVSHGGGQVGYRSKIIRYLDHKVTVIFLSNMENDEFWTYTGDIATLYMNVRKERFIRK